ncbi:SemiSWEET family transporter [Liquorilactobacillus capillatus]|nr:SemiSWEET family transporter [Liquorilactobacillus capillatus]
MKQEARFIQILGRVATVLAVLMYVSYIPQIMNNLQGNYGNPIQPLVAALNCTFWCVYAYFKMNRDWPVFWANFPGIFFGLITFITSLH